jgi:hypothetical protein
MSNRIMYATGGSIVLAINCEVSPGAAGRVLSWVDASHIQCNAESYIRVGDGVLIVDTNTPIGWADLDTGAAAAGTDYFVYACLPGSGTTPVFKISTNASYPSGYNVSTSRKIGGFHTLCMAVGTIGGHPLTDYAIKSILPYSLWDLKHKPSCSDPRGMVYNAAQNEWVDIYLASGTGASTASAYGGTISDTRNWMDFVDDFIAVDKKLLTDSGFQSAAAGSNEETNISGSADPVTTGGHSDTASRRMISNIGCEDMCGAMWQWLLDQSFRIDGLPDTGDPTWAYQDLSGSKGSLYKQGTYGDVKLLAGGAWNDGSRCGSRARFADSCRWYAGSSLGGRGRADHVKLG